MDWVHALSARDFRRAFRMTRHAFFSLLRLVRTDLETNTTMAEKSSGSPVTPLIKLAATIRWLVWHDTQPSRIPCVVFCCVVFCCVLSLVVFVIFCLPFLYVLFYRVLSFVVFLYFLFIHWKKSRSPCHFFFFNAFCLSFRLFCLSALPLGRRHVYWYMCSFWSQPILLLPPRCWQVIDSY